MFRPAGTVFFTPRPRQNRLVKTHPSHQREAVNEAAQPWPSGSELSGSMDLTVTGAIRSLSEKCEAAFAQPRMMAAALCSGGGGGGCSAAAR